MQRSKPLELRISERSTSRVHFSLVLPEGDVLRGSFADFECNMTVIEKDLTKSILNMTLYSDSAQGQTPEITHRLRGSSCFNVSLYRVITFHSTGWEKLNEKEYLLYGKLSMCGQSKLIVLEVTDHGRYWDADTLTRLNRLEFNTTIKRSAYNMGTPVGAEVSDEVTVTGMLSFKNEVTWPNPQP